MVPRCGYHGTVNVRINTAVLQRQILRDVTGIRFSYDE